MAFQMPDGAVEAGAPPQQGRKKTEWAGECWEILKDYNKTCVYLLPSFCSRSAVGINSAQEENFPPPLASHFR